jgi:hypothetical protein
VKDVEEARTIDLRTLLAVGVLVAVVAITLLWSTGAFAAGGSSSDRSSGNAPALIQQNDQPPAREDCPEGRGGPADAGPGAPQGNSDGSGSPDL